MSQHAISCPKYEAMEGSRRCRSYLDNGGCARPDELMCVEWLKRNGHPVAAPHEEASSPGTPPGQPPQVLAARVLTDEALESFRALGLEVCLTDAGAGSVWLVPEYTEQDRKELRVDHAATLAALCSAFPGARISAFHHAASVPATRRP